MFHLFFALFMAFACPAHHTNTNCSGTTVTAQDTPPPPPPPDTGGEGGHVPPDRP